MSGKGEEGVDGVAAQEPQLGIVGREACTVLCVCVCVCVGVCGCVCDCVSVRV